MCVAILKNPAHTTHTCLHKNAYLIPQHRWIWPSFFESFFIYSYFDFSVCWAFHKFQFESVAKIKTQQRRNRYKNDRFEKSHTPNIDALCVCASGGNSNENYADRICALIYTSTSKRNEDSAIYTIFEPNM